MIFTTVRGVIIFNEPVVNAGATEQRTMEWQDTDLRVKSSLDLRP